MRDIRARITRRGGLDLSDQQIEDLAVRRLESILDPRAMKPEFLNQLRRSADEFVERQGKTPSGEPAYAFEDTTIYDSHRGALRFIRRLLNPLLKLFFNPNPLIRALHLQARLNVEAAERDAERDRRQAEWNALHYKIVERLVTEVSRVSIELQSLSMRVESLDAKVEFNERRVRSIEGSVHRSRPLGRPADAVAASPAASPTVESEAAPANAVTATVEGQPSAGTRRRRRRRRGRRLGMTPGEAAAAPLPAGAPPAPADANADPQPAVERAQDAGAASPRPAPPPLFPPPAPDERAAPEPPAEQPGADRTEP